MTTLSVSIVSHFSDRAALSETLRSLADAFDAARQAGRLANIRVRVVDNSLTATEGTALRELVAMSGVASLNAEILIATENRGYGAANNLAIADIVSDFHLVLNPDVVLAPDAISCSIAALQRHPDAVLLTPHATDAAGQPQYVAKAMPGIFTLLARALPGVPASVRDRLGNARYEMREQLGSATVMGEFLAGGCFMFCRTEALKAVHGFDEDYFMYFEDFDLSRRLAGRGKILYAPSVRIRHGGGHAAGKGLRHILWFGRSALRFLGRHGWRWVS